MKIIGILKDLLNPFTFRLKRTKITIFKEICCFFVMILWTYTGAPMPPQAAKSVFYDYKSYMLPYEVQLASYIPLTKDYLSRNTFIPVLNMASRFTGVGFTGSQRINSGSVYELNTPYESHYSLKEALKEPPTIKSFLEYTLEERFKRPLFFLQKKIRSLNFKELTLTDLYSVYCMIAPIFNKIVFFIIFFEFLFTTQYPYYYEPSQIDLNAVKDNLRHGYITWFIDDYRELTEKNLKNSCGYTIAYITESFTLGNKVPFYEIFIANKKTDLDYEVLPNAKPPNYALVFYSSPFWRMFDPTENSLVNTSKFYLLWVATKNFLKRSVIYVLILLGLYLGRFILKKSHQSLVSKGYDNLLTVVLHYLSVESVYTSFVSLLFLGPALIYDFSLFHTAFTGVHPYHYVMKYYGPLDANNNIIQPMDPSKIIYEMKKLHKGFLGNHTIIGWALLLMNLPALTQGFPILRGILLCDFLTRPDTIINGLTYGIARVGGVFNILNWAHLGQKEGASSILHIVINILVYLFSSSIIFEMTLLPFIFLSSGFTVFRTALRNSWLSNTGSTSLIKNIHWLFNQKELNKRHKQWRDEEQIFNTIIEFKNSKTFTQKNFLINNSKTDLVPFFNKKLYLQEDSNLTYASVLKEKELLNDLRIVDTNLGKVKPLTETYIEEVTAYTFLERLQAILLIMGLTITETLVKFGLLVTKYTFEVTWPLKLMASHFNYGGHLLFFQVPFMFTF